MITTLKITLIAKVLFIPSQIKAANLAALNILAISLFYWSWFKARLTGA